MHIVRDAVRLSTCQYTLQVGHVQHAWWGPSTLIQNILVDNSLLP